MSVTADGLLKIYYGIFLALLYLLEFSNLHG